MHFTVEAQDRIRRHVEFIRTGECHYTRPLLALDATAGNGLDTCFLAELVGHEGRVVALDLQEAAIQITQCKLEEMGWIDRVDCHRDCHSNLTHHLHAYSANGLHIAMFNLGYLPFGNKEIITKRETSISALSQAYDLLASFGIMSVLSYPGHTGGSDEHLAIETWMEHKKTLSRIESFRDENNRRSPVLWIVYR